MTAREDRSVVTQSTKKRGSGGPSPTSLGGPFARRIAWHIDATVGHRRILVLLLAVAVTAVALAGCLWPNDDETFSEPPSREPLPNRPPLGSIEVAPNIGYPPLRVAEVVSLSDPDGDDVVFSYWIIREDGLFGGGLYNATAYASYGWDSGKNNGTYYAPGVYTYTLEVSDGEFTVTNTTTLTVLDPNPPPLIFEFNGTVTETCIHCTGQFAPDTPRIGSLGGNACRSYIQQTPGPDCIWFPLSNATWAGFYEAESSGGDVDLEFRSECGLDPRTTTGGGYRPGRAESGYVPNGTRCVILWEMQDAPSTIQLVITAK